MDLPNQIIVTQMTAGEHPSSMAGRADIIIDAQYLPSEKDEFGPRRSCEARDRGTRPHILPSRSLSARTSGPHRMDTRCRLRRDPGRQPVRHDAPACSRDGRPVAETLRIWCPQRHRPPHRTSATRRRSILAPAIRHRRISRTSGFLVRDLIDCTKVIALAVQKWCG